MESVGAEDVLLGGVLMVERPLKVDIHPYPWNGTNEVGFSVVNTGLRHLNGWFAESVWYWSRNPNSNWRVDDTSVVFWGADPLGWGGSIRCIKDAE